MARIKSSRLLRVAAVLFTVCVVTFSNPLTASAAATGTMTFTLEGSGLESTVPGVNNTSCRLPWAVNAGGLIIGSSARCDGGPDYSPGHCQPFEGACGSYSLSIKSSSGATIGSVSFQPFDIGGGIGSVKAGLGGGYVPLSNPATASQACLNYQFSPSIGGSTDTTSCVDISVDDPGGGGQAGGSCVHGTPHLKYGWERTVTHQPGYYTYELAVYVTVRGAPVSTAQWWITPQGNHGRTPTQAVTSNRVVFSKQEWISQAPPRPTGVEVWATPDAWNTDGDTSAPYLVSSTRPIKKGDPYAGWTQPAHCRFYFGAPIVNDGDPTTTEDVPVTDGATDYVEPPPAEPPVADPPVVDTPDTDSGMLAGLLALLRAILAAILGLASTIASAIAKALSGIVDAIIDGIKALFVPEAGFFDTQFARLDGKFDDTAPGKYVGAVESWTPSSGGSSGCSGPTVELPLGGQTRSFNPLDACSGGMATAATMSRLLATVALVVFGGLACVRALGSGLGWNPGVANGGEQ